MIPAVRGGKDLWNQWVLSLKSKSEGVMDGKIGDDENGGLSGVK